MAWTTVDLPAPAYTPSSAFPQPTAPRYDACADDVLPVTPQPAPPRTASRRTACDIACAMIIPAVLALMCAAAVAGAVLIRVRVDDPEHARYVATHVPTTFTVTNVSLGAYACCEARDCACAETTAPPCAEMTAALQPGTCGGGYRCCATVCQTCWDTCYLTCCDTCKRSYTCSGGRTCKESYPCNCLPCRPYPCRPHDCNCVCTASVANQRCTSVCGTCYAPSYTLAYVATVDAMDERMTIPRPAPRSCGVNDRACADAYLAPWPLGSEHGGTYNPEAPSVDVDVGGSPSNYRTRDTLLAGYVVLSLLAAALACTACVTGAAFWNAVAPAPV